MSRTNPTTGHGPHRLGSSSSAPSLRTGSQATRIPPYHRLARRKNPGQLLAHTTQSSDPRPTVFLVDDDKEMRRSLVWLLERNGYRVVASASPAEALAAYDPDQPGCLLIDIQLPDATGMELYDELRQRGRVHPFIVITAYGRIPLAVEAMRLGAVDFIEKPFDRDQLLQRIGEAVARDRKNRETDEERTELLGRLAVLGPREREVAELVAEGRSSKEIARALGIKVRTVEVHRHHINKKLGTESPAELTAFIAKVKSLDE